MDPHGQLPVVLIACKVFQEILARRLPPNPGRRVTFLDMGLHTLPNKLNTALQQTINAIEEPSIIFLGYGLCGNGLHGIRSGMHTLVVPRADDCISIFLGSQKAYYEAFQANPGTYYLTKAWLESSDTPLHQYRDSKEKYGQEIALWLLDQQYQHYTRLAFIAHTETEFEKYRPLALEVAQFCQRWGMVYEEILGSESFVQRIVEGVEDPSKLAGDFIIIRSESVINQNDFRYRT